MSDTQQAMPQVSGPLVDANGIVTQAWWAFFRSLWNRTGGGAGVSTDDVAILSALQHAGSEGAGRELTEAKLFALSLQRPAGAKVVASDAVVFGFGADGLLADNEQLSIPAASWPVDVSFTANADSYLNAFAAFPATADAVFRITDIAFTVLGTITVLAGATSGTLAWVTDPYVHPANTSMLVFAPLVADATLGNVNALVVGKAA